MDTVMNSGAGAIRPDVLQLLIAASQSAGMELNAYIRSLLPPSSGAISSSLALRVEPQYISPEEAQRLREEFHEYSLGVSGPEEALQKGRENWAREHGY